jgi:outer membrane protein insertion porin family
MSINLFYEIWPELDSRSYQIQKYGVENSFYRELGRVSRVWSAFKFERVDISIDTSDVKSEQPDNTESAAANSTERSSDADLEKALGESIRLGLSLSLERDTRDDIFQPTKGSLTQVFSEIVGGDDHYVKIVGSWSRYQLFFRPTVLASRVRVGWAKDYESGRDIPPDVRFYAGGANTVRGMRERLLGPQEVTYVEEEEVVNPLGGQGLFLFNVELRRALWWRLGGSAFVDVGNVWSRLDTATWDQLRVTTGLELWVSTPVGPIRVAYGTVVAKGQPREDDPSSAWHLAISFAF